MADWANSTTSYIRPYRHPLGSPPIRYFEESTCAATAIIQYGDVVSFDTVVGTAAHRIVRAPSSGGTGTNLLQVGVTSLLGIAAENSTSDGSTSGLINATAVGPVRPNRKIGVWVADVNTEFLGFLSSVGGPNLAASTLIGVAKPLLYSRTFNRFFVDSSNSTAALAAVKITDIPSESIGDSNGPVIFKFLSTNIALNATQ